MNKLGWNLINKGRVLVLGGSIDLTGFCHYCACASSQYWHRVSFPKVSNNRIYFGANQHT